MVMSMKKILIADDTKNIRLMLGKCMEVSGWEVSYAENGKQTLELMAEQSFHLVMMDIKMPEMSGTEVLRRLRNRGDQTPVIVMTAYGTIKNAVETTNMGAVAYLQKPFTAEKVRKTLEQISLETDEPQEAPAALWSEAEALIAQNHTQQALDLLNAALSKHSLNAEAYRLLAQCCDKLGREEDSKRYKKLFLALLD